MPIKALVYGGYYGKKNIGDDLFQGAFQTLFPEISFTFTDNFTKSNIEQADMIIFGGGSFLYAPIKSENISDVIPDLLCKQIFYIGVGIETDIHPMHQILMKNAGIIATRSAKGKERLKYITTHNVIEIPDIVYALSEQIDLQSVKKNSVLILSNAELLPRWNDIQWKHASWNYFKSEFSQFLDILKEQKHTITFGAMCSNSHLNDLGAAVELINQMKARNFDSQIILSDDFTKLTQTLSQYDIIISQRYHGAILADMCRRPCISIAHHDKLKNPTASAFTVPYYGLSKQMLIDTFLKCKTHSILPIKLDIFEDMRARVYSQLGAKCPNLLVSKMAKYR
jgi:polysaccharide pyruvyl transferase WcaK-like protein